MVCPRCQRTHQGLCGIPPSIRGARQTGKYIMEGAPKSASLPKHTLEGLLLLVKREHKAVTDWLNLVPLSMPVEYNKLQYRLEELERQLVQIRRQLVT